MIHKIKHGIKHGAKHSIRAMIALMLTVVLMISLLTTGLAIFLNSPAGLQFSQRFLMQIFKAQGDELVIQNLTGTLSNFSATHLAFKSPSIEINAENIHLDSLPGMLLFWKLQIKAIEFSALEIQLHENHLSSEANSKSQNNQSSQSSITLLKLLPEISIQHIGLPKLKITFSNGRVLNTSLEMKKTGQITTVSHFNLRYPPLRLKLQHSTDFKNTSSGLAWKDLCLMDSTKNSVCLSGHWQDNLNFYLLLKANLTHLSLLDDIFPQVMNTSGKITGTLSTSMKKGIPSFSGELNLIDGSTYIPITGMHPEDLNATLSPEKNALRLIGTGRSESGEYGSGKFLITGLFFNESNNSNKNNKTNENSEFLSLSLIGENINVVNLSAGVINASPNLTYKINHSTQSISGNILITHANINGDKIHTHASNDSDVVFVSPSGEIEERPGHLFGSNISVILGDDVHFKGFGIKATLKGQLLIQSEPGDAILGTGLWKISEGEYDTYGKKFFLKDGALIFNRSPLSDPILNIKAIYDLPPTIIQGDQAQNIQLGVSVTGTLSNPKFGFFSNPPMSQSDILSYIVLGTPLRKASTNQQAQLSQAALSYALNNENLSLVTDLKQDLGIDSLNVGSINTVPAENLSGENTVTETNNTAVFIGKQVTPRLYVSYGLGIFNQEFELKTQFAISSHWSFLTNSATSGNGADIVYTLDKN